MDTLAIDANAIHIETPCLDQEILDNPELITCWLKAISYVRQSGNDFSADSISVYPGSWGLLQISIEDTMGKVAMTPTECLKLIFEHQTHPIDKTWEFLTDEEKRCRLNLN